MSIKHTYSIVLALVVGISLVNTAWAQNASAPGSGNTGDTASAPLPGGVSTSVVAPGGSRVLSVISLHDAEKRTNDLKNMAQTAPSPQILEQVSVFCDWIGDLYNAHNQLAATFAKGEGTRTASETEKQTASKFSLLKNQALLIKAQLLVKMNRYVEAIIPLVEIVKSAPSQSTASKEAYRYLQDIGFSEIPILTSQATKSPPQVKH